MFKIVFITEGDDCVPAAEIRFDGQRLCIIRLDDDGPVLELVQDHFTDRPPVTTFPLSEFMLVADTAAKDLVAWSANLSHGQDGA